jgi:dienelactone hydrolase
VAPLLFGEAGGPGRGLWPAFSQCGNDEFSCNSGERTSPIVQWLRELAVDVNRRWPKGAGVGVIGMCLTGAFPLAMLREQVVVAPVLCQPTLPFSPWNITARFGWFTDKDALAISVDDLRHAKERREVPILGLRYKGDWRCRQERFDRLQKEFGTRFDPLVLEGSHHSTLGGDFCDLAFQRVVTFLKKQLYLRASLIDDPPAAAVAGAACPTKPAACAAASHHGSME